MQDPEHFLEGTMKTLLPIRRTAGWTFPWREIDGFENRLGGWLDEPFFGAETFGWVPSVDIVENDHELLLTAELPGLDEKYVEIEVEGNVLTLKGEKTDETEKEEEKGGYKMRMWERRYGEFSRSFTLPGTIDTAKIEASFDKGVLTVHMPKTVEAKGRRIAIKAK